MFPYFLLLTHKGKTQCGKINSNFHRAFHFLDSGGVGSEDKIFNEWKEKLWESLWKSPPRWTGRTLHCVLMAVDMIVLSTLRSTGAAKSLHHCGTLSDAMHYHSDGELLLENLTATHSSEYNGYTLCILASPSSTIIVWCIALVTSWLVVS